MASARRRIDDTVIFAVALDTHSTTLRAFLSKKPTRLAHIKTRSYHVVRTGQNPIRIGLAWEEKTCRVDDPSGEILEPEFL